MTKKSESPAVNRANKTEQKQYATKPSATQIKLNGAIHAWAGLPKQMLPIKSGAMPLANYNIESGDEQVYFRNIKPKLLEHISSAPYIVGAIAWLHDSEILEALALKNGVSIIIGKEDLLRPDITREKDLTQRLREQYSKLKAIPRFITGSRITPAVSGLSYCSNPDIDPVRCIGMTSDYLIAKMHNKFLVFCRGQEQDGNLYLDPYAVWTGSFNFAVQSGVMLENVLYIENPRIADAYFAEWGQLAAYSEPLDWSSDFVTPQWRQGS